jgi:LytS/YehU family sensor histidine kinase
LPVNSTINLGPFAIPFTDFFFVITPENDFHRTRRFPILASPLVVIMLLNITGLIQRRKKLSKRYIIALLIYMIPLTIFIVIHAFIDIEMVLFLGVGICALSMYSLIVSDYIMQIIRQEREIAHQRASVMALQMRPHFIYNTMMSIYYLCKQDADKAQQVTLDFTSYLRKNFTAIASEELVPFKDELEHARAYLAVEQAQHEDMLYVDYDTLHTDFSVPSLTLQPLVENAVKHSLDPNGDPLHIYVRTQQTDKASAIIVENNGLDYQPSDDNEPHIALSNIRQRLRMMCKGELTIATREGGGTIVKVIIPNT